MTESLSGRRFILLQDFSSTENAKVMEKVFQMKFKMR